VVATAKSATGLVLFGTSACHLCELAQEVLEYYSGHCAEIQFSTSDISESNELFQQYGLKIPVLRRDDGRELDWPFSVEELGRFLN
jgi:hypothetical protein